MSCLAAEAQLHDMYNANATTLAPLEYHGYDDMKCDDAIARMQYYNATTTPTMAFDGTVTDQPYTAWPSIFTARKAVKSPLKIELTVKLTGNNFEATAKITRGGTVPDTNLKLRFAVTEDGLVANGTTFNTVLRKMYPNATGTAITLPAAETKEFKVTGALNSSWKKDKLHYIVWVQNDGTKEVYQTKLLKADEITDLNTPTMADVRGMYR